MIKNLFQGTFDSMDHFGREHMDLENVGNLFADDPPDFVSFDDLASGPIVGNMNENVETTLGDEKSGKKILAPLVAFCAASHSTISPESTNCVPMNLRRLLFPNQWKQQPATPSVPTFQTSPTALAPAIFSPPMPQITAAPVPLRSLAPNMMLVHFTDQNLTQKQPQPFARFDWDEYQKKEKKRLAVRKCRDKKRKEIKELETRASHFDMEIKQLQNELKYARTEGNLVENSDTDKNLKQVHALLATLCSQNMAEFSAISSRLLSINCTANTPALSAEACGREAVLAHFKHLASCFSVTDFDICTESVCSMDTVIRCRWSLCVRQIATAFGIIMGPDGAIPMALDGSCRFSFCEGMVVDIICSWNHSALVLHLLGIPPTSNEGA
jgi:hypothetical protein